MPNLRNPTRQVVERQEGLLPLPNYMLKYMIYEDPKQQACFTRELCASLLTIGPVCGYA